jgi:hypothetical protein
MQKEIELRKDLICEEMVVELPQEAHNLLLEQDLARALQLCLAPKPYSKLIAQRLHLQAPTAD